MSCKGMTRKIFWMAGAVGLTAVAWLTAQVAGGTGSPLQWFPRGAVLTLEAKDFGQLLREWNASTVKREWLASDAYRQFAVSRLALRLQDAQQEFASAAAVPVDLTFTQQLAGENTVLALYNIGELEFLYVTRLPEARFAQSLLGAQRESLSPRNVAGTPYFVSAKNGSRRAVAFALRGDWLLLATTESLLAECLQRMASQAPGGGLASEEWFAKASQAGGGAGDLRLITNLEGLYRTPQFRSYWIHRNRTELAPYGATVSNLDRTAAAYTERRVLLRKEPQTAPANGTAAELLRAVPANAGLFRAWSNPDPAMAAGIFVQKFAGGTDGFPVGEILTAPELGELAEAGAETAWEQSIEEAPFAENRSGPDASRMVRWLTAARLTGLLHVQSTRDGAGNVWIQQETGLLLVRNGNWNAAEVQEEMAALSPLPLQTAIDGNRLLISGSAAGLAAMRSGSGAAVPAAAGASFVGGFRHRQEGARFTRWMQRIDQPHVAAGSPDETAPQFLPGVVGGLSRVMRGVAEQSVIVKDAADRVEQTVIYRMQP